MTATALIATASADAAVPASPWLQTGATAAGSQANLAETTLSPANVASLRRQQTIAGNSDYDGCGFGATATAISESRIYTIVDDRVTAYNLYSGSVIWRATNPAATNFLSYDRSIAVSHGRVVISGNECGSNDPAGFVQAFDSTTGAPLWNHLYGDGISAVEVSGSYVVAHVFGRGQITDPSTSVYRIADGATVWTSAAYCQSAAKVVRQLVFVYVCSPTTGAVYIRALALATGAPVWTVSTGAAVTVGDSDASTARHLYYNDAAHLRDVDPSTGLVRFTLSGAYEVLAVDTTRVYVHCDTGVCAYDVATGTPLWRSSLVQTSDGVEANGVLYLGGGYVLNAATGRQVSRLPASTIGTSVVAVGSGHVATVDDHNVVQVYGL